MMFFNVNASDCNSVRVLSRYSWYFCTGISVKTSKCNHCCQQSDRN